MRKNQYLLATLTLCLVSPTLVFAQADAAFKQMQSQLDQQCEAARQAALAPAKKDIFNECMSKSGSTGSQAECEAEAAAYTGQRQGGAPRFYELPECVKAFEHSKQGD